MSDPCTPADAARWLRENGPSVVWPTVTVERYAAYAAHVLGRVEVCGECGGNQWACCCETAQDQRCDACYAADHEECEEPVETPCPRCAGRGWTLTEAT